MVPPSAHVSDVRTATLREGHLRVLVGREGVIDGVVHVRDTLLLPDDVPISGIIRPVLTLDGGLSLHDALAQMRARRSHVTAIVDDGRLLGVVSLADVVHGLITPEPDDPADRQ
jgi:CBS domain containing-hemolysin-like protein